MSRREIPQTSQDLESQLTTIIPEYKEVKDQEKIIKKQVDDLGGKIKSAMKSLNKTEFAAGGVVASITETPKSEFNELQAIEILRAELTPDQFAKVVKTREYIDDEAFEKMVYAHEVDAAILAPATTPLAPTVTLRLKKEKK